MKQLQNLYRQILTEGWRVADRTGTGTVGLFAPPPLVFDLADGFPLQTTKRVYLRGVFTELMFFLRGEHRNGWLTERDTHIWDEWRSALAGVDGVSDDELGPIYGVQWRHFGGDLHAWTPTLQPNPERHRDQLAALIDGLRNNPFGRRHVMSTWSFSQLSDMALPPCHGIATQFNVQPDADGRPSRLNVSTFQRSADSFLGLPFNIASYALLVHMLAAELNLAPGVLTLNLGDAHLYLDHVEHAETVLARDPRPLPMLELQRKAKEPGALLPDYTFEDLVLTGYDPHPKIAARVSV